MAAGLSSHHGAHKSVHSLALVAASFSLYHGLCHVSPSPAQTATNDHFEAPTRNPQTGHKYWLNVACTRAPSKILQNQYPWWPASDHTRESLSQLHKWHTWRADSAGTRILLTRLIHACWVSLHTTAFPLQSRPGLTPSRPDGPYHLLMHQQQSRFNCSSRHTTHTRDDTSGAPS